MTPGHEALAEAMRIEQARIYGQLQPEANGVESAQTRAARELDEQILRLRDQGESYAAIALRLGTSKSHAHDVVRRAS